MLRHHYTEEQLDTLARRGIEGEAEPHLRNCLRCKILNAILKTFYMNFAGELRTHPHVIVDEFVEAKSRRRPRR